MRLFSRLTLLWKILLSTSVAITVLFALTGWIVQSSAVSTASRSLEDEVRTSFHAYDSLWKSRVELLRSASLLLSNMSDVRAAFSTGDQATIRDTAGELWSKISSENAVFLVTDPLGNVIASLGGAPAAMTNENFEAVRLAARRFPEQATGFWVRDRNLYQVAITPVYVQTGQGTGLLNVLVAGYHVDALVAGRLKEATGGSEFLFLIGGSVMASSLPAAASRAIAAALPGIRPFGRVSDGSLEYTALSTPLFDIQGKPIGQLSILRSYESAARHMAALRRTIVLLWLVFIASGLALTYVLARSILEPVKALDRAAAEVARQNYDCRIEVASEDELGRLARTFNVMCASIRQAQEELIRQERISTIGRLTSSIVHDLRNPLAAIYGGAEMLVDSELAPAQVKRLAGNIYRASRRMQELLQDLLNVARGKGRSSEVCRLQEVVAAACEVLHAAADAQSVSISVHVPEEIELPLDRSRMERVFVNLVSNALEVMPDGGNVFVHAHVADGEAQVEVRDTGPGIAPQIRARLFQPFVTLGKKNGMGLGLALSRQTILDHGGDMTVESQPGRGACFRIRLPLNAAGVLNRQFK